MTAKSTFRSWLRSIVDHAVVDWVRSPANRDHVRGTEETRQRLASLEAREDLDARVSAAFDLELLEVAEERARDSSNPTYWKCYVLVKKERRSLKDAAAIIGLPIKHVSQYAIRMALAIQAELASLDPDLDSPNTDPRDGA